MNLRIFSSLKPVALLFILLPLLLCIQIIFSFVISQNASDNLPYPEADTLF